MKSDTSIPVVDIFAGAGGLGEGFEAYAGGGRFHVALSAEMDGHAVRTLRTRAFFRSFDPGDAPRSYYDYLAGRRDAPWTADTEALWLDAGERARRVQLGKPEDDAFLDERIGKIACDARKRSRPWVLVGGPPCQAFSIVGRARNSAIAGYIPENDQRHYLYEHYLHILSKHQPAVFVLENVKGMLSSRVGGARIFEQIFEHLQQPGGPGGPRYRIEPITLRGSSKSGWEPNKFIVRGECLGLPQNRHRVILVGVLEDLGRNIQPLQESAPTTHLSEMIGDLPEIRSSSTSEDVASWASFARRSLSECARLAKAVDAETAKHLQVLAAGAKHGWNLGTGGRWLPSSSTPRLPKHLIPLMRDQRLHGILQHQSRPHMTADLLRYAYASAFAAMNDRSPKGSQEFPPELHPLHKSWAQSDRFVDRFKVQRWDAPASTITSHIAKDGHYYIHPDPYQMRSLSVREAARLQTFPDNFLFEGPAGAQRKQVGNAVPPWLGHQVAGVVHGVLD